MKTVKPYYDDVVELYCSCPGCEDKLVVSVENKFYDNDDPFCFHIQYAEPSNLWWRIKRAWKYIVGHKTPELSYDCILLSSIQINELSRILHKRVKKYRKAMGTYDKGPKHKSCGVLATPEDYKNELDRLKSVEEKIEDIKNN